MPYFPDLVLREDHHLSTDVWLYVGDNGAGEPTFDATSLNPDATIEIRDERRHVEEGLVQGLTFPELHTRYQLPSAQTRSLAGNDVMIDTDGRLYLWAGRSAAEPGVSSWWQVAPEEADDYRRSRDRALSSGDYQVHVLTRAGWERNGVPEHGPVTFTEPEPSIDPVPAPEQRSSAAYYLAPATTTTGASYARDSVTFTANSITLTALATVTPVHAPPAEAVLVADGGYVLIPAGLNGDNEPTWRAVNTAASTWTQIRDRHVHAHRARTGGGSNGLRYTFAVCSERLRNARVMTPADLPPDLIDGRGRRWLHVGWHEGPRYRLAEAGFRPYETERQDLMASCPDSGFNVARAWTRDRIARAHGDVTERARTRWPYFLVGSGETAVAPGRGGGTTPTPPAAPATVVVDPAAGVRPGDTPTPGETYQARPADWCRESGPRGSYRCSRRPGHVGHHVAAHAERVVAVWTDQEHYLPEFGGGNITREEYTAHLHARGIVAPGETLGPATPSGSMIAEPDPVERALAALATAEQTASAYREQVRDRAIRGYTSDREYPSPAAVNVSLRNLHLPEYKVKYRAQVLVEFDVETDDPGAARQVAASMARPLSAVTTEGVSGSVTASVYNIAQGIVR